MQAVVFAEYKWEKMTSFFTLDFPRRLPLNLKVAVILTVHGTQGQLCFSILSMQLSISKINSSFVTGTHTHTRCAFPVLHLELNNLCSMSLLWPIFSPKGQFTYLATILLLTKQSTCIWEHKSTFVLLTLLILQYWLANIISCYYFFVFIAVITW